MEFERDIQIEAGHRQELWWSHADVSQVCLSQWRKTQRRDGEEKKLMLTHEAVG